MDWWIRRWDGRAARMALATPGGVPPAAFAEPVPHHADPVLRWNDAGNAPDGPFERTAIPNAMMGRSRVPDRDDSWETIFDFALSYDGNAYWEDLPELANRWLRRWTRDRSLPASVDELRACLFYEQRRWHHFGEYPHGRGAEYVHALLDALADAVAPGRADDDRTREAQGESDEEAGAERASIEGTDLRWFGDDDGAYLTWTTSHPHGFVVNIGRQSSAGNVRLHRATCSAVVAGVDTARTFTRFSRKVWGADYHALSTWCLRQLGATPEPCRRCRPRPERPVL